MTEIRAARPGDVEAIADICDEIDVFYGDTPAERGRRTREITRALFSDPPMAFALLAFSDGRPVGFAGYSYLWPASGTSTSMFLKELYVTEALRRTGLGRQLMHELFRIAQRNGLTRVEWMTDTGNLDAQDFYSHLGVTPDKGKVFYRVQNADLASPSPDDHAG